MFEDGCFLYTRLFSQVGLDLKEIVSVEPIMTNASKKGEEKQEVDSMLSGKTNKRNPPQSPGDTPLVLSSSQPRGSLCSLAL